MRSSWYFLISYGPKSYVVRPVMRQLVYTMFIPNNHDFFHLWWHDNFVKYQNVSKYYDQDCTCVLFFQVCPLLGGNFYKDNPNRTWTFCPLMRGVGYFCPLFRGLFIGISLVRSSNVCQLFGSAGHSRCPLIRGFILSAIFWMVLGGFSSF